MNESEDKSLTDEEEAGEGWNPDLGVEALGDPNDAQ